MRKRTLITILAAILAVTTCIIFSPNSAREDWELLKSGGRSKAESTGRSR